MRDLLRSIAELRALQQSLIWGFPGRIGDFFFQVLSNRLRVVSCEI